MAGEDRYQPHLTPTYTIAPIPGITQVLVMLSDGTYIIKQIREADMLFVKYPESYAQLIGDELQAAFEKARANREIVVKTLEGKLE